MDKICFVVNALDECVFFIPVSAIEAFLILFLSFWAVVMMFKILLNFMR